MRILIAPDKFKHSLGALEVARNLGAGIAETYPAADLRLFPMADGGEGTADVIHRAVGGEWVECNAHDALGRKIRARWLCVTSSAGRKIAVVEMSEAAGLARLHGIRSDPNEASSFGVGEMLLHSASAGVDEIVVGLGGSATNDGGLGMARALGTRFIDREGDELLGPVAALRQLRKIIDVEHQMPLMRGAADVRIPLLGNRGATFTFALQKGARPGQLAELEAALSCLAEVAARDLGHDFRDVAGAGAGGGLGFGLMAFCGARIESGFELVSQMVGLEAAVQAADVIVTGEGSLDRQTLEGKVPAGIATLARRCGKSVFAVAGVATEDARVRGLFDCVRVLADPGTPREESIARCAELLREAGRDIGANLARRGS